MTGMLNDRYVLGDQIGAGGMAVVHLAWDRQEKRDVAIKILRSEFNEDVEFVRRFNLEAQAASKMSHENIVGIYGVGQDEDTRYIVMEYVNGRTLKEVIRQAGRIKPERAVQITLKILAAVDCAHKNHVIHRDIKPHNILVDVKGNIKVADFGIARATNASTHTYNESGNVLGSVHYFSPEQASGQTADEKSDLYSVGVVLYEMVTGEVPFDGENSVAVALKHVHELPMSARSKEPAVSRGLDQVIMKALNKDAAYRYQTAAQMALDLKRSIRMPKGGFVDREEMPRRKLRERVRDSYQNRTSPRHLRIALIVLLCIFLLAGGLYGANRLYRYIFLRQKMPTLVLLDVEEAVSRLDELQLPYTLSERHDETVRFGSILEQRPAPDSPVWKGDRVSLVVSAGVEKLIMPKLLDLPRTEAVKLLEENHLVLGDVNLDIADAKPGTVIAQIPPVNEWVQPGDRVDLVISGESAYVPDLANYTTEEAEGLLIAEGFTLGQVGETYDAEAEPGLIVSQSRQPGTRALMGEAIDVTVCVQPPTLCRACTTVVVQVPAKGVEAVCTLVESTGEREVYRQILEEGRQEIYLELDSLESGVHAVRLYLDGVQVDEKEIDFIEDDM